MKEELLSSMLLTLESICLGKYFFLTLGRLTGKEIEQIHALVDLNVAVLVILFGCNAFER